jgi:hypothetical protein
MSRDERPGHRVTATSSFARAGRVQFAEADLKTPLPKKLTFADADKIES